MFNMMLITVQPRSVLGSTIYLDSVQILSGGANGIGWHSIGHIMRILTIPARILTALVPSQYLTSMTIRLAIQKDDGGIGFKEGTSSSCSGSTGCPWCLIPKLLIF